MMEWDWERAEESLKRAIALDPALIWAYYVYGLRLTLEGRFDEAIEQMQRARRLDPVSISPVGYDLGMLYALEGDLESAARAWQEALELEPDNYLVRRQLGSHFCRTGDFENGLQELEKATSVSHDEERLMSDLGWCHALAGNREKARAYLEEIEARAQLRYVDPVHMALIHQALGETDRAFERLERAYEIHGPLLVEVPTDPRYIALHSDPRWEELLRGVGLEALLPPPKG